MMMVAPTCPGSTVSRRCPGPENNALDVVPSTTTSRSPISGISRYAIGVPIANARFWLSVGPIGAVPVASSDRNSSNLRSWAADCCSRPITVSCSSMVIDTMNTMISAARASCRRGLSGGISVLAGAVVVAVGASGAEPVAGVAERDQRVRQRDDGDAAAVAVIRCP